MSVRSIMIGALLLAMALCPVQASVLYVEDDAASGGDGLSWETAFHDLQLALDVAQVEGSGVTEIRIAAGTYRPTRRVYEDTLRTESFQLINGVTIAGGYRGCPDGDCTGGDPDERDWIVYETILSGDLNGDDVEEDFPFGGSLGENAFHVVVLPEELDATRSAVLEGCIVTAGFATDYSRHHRGGGVFGELSTALLRDCMVEGNYASNGGGGVYVTTAAVITLERCVITRNVTAHSGGGIAGRQARLVLSECAVTDNTAKDDGGGIELHECVAFLSLCEVVGNVALDNDYLSHGDGGGIRSLLSELTMTNCGVRGNVAGNYGGGLCVYNSAIASLTDCEFSGNMAGWGGGIFCHHEIAIENCDFVRNVATMGGGVCAYGGSSTFRDCRIVANIGLGNAAGFHSIADAETQLIRCVIEQNETPGDGGGILCDSAVGVSVCECRIERNTAGGAEVDSVAVRMAGLFLSTQ